jgi:hypothetical protein
MAGGPGVTRGDGMWTTSRGEKKGGEGSEGGREGNSRFLIKLYSKFFKCQASILLISAPKLLNFSSIFS